MKKLKNILFKPNKFKDILSEMFILPGFAIGFCGSSIYSHPQDTLLWITLLTISVILTIWMFAYKFKNKK